MLQTTDDAQFDFIAGGRGYSNEGRKGNWIKQYLIENMPLIACKIHDPLNVLLFCVDSGCIDSLLIFSSGDDVHRRSDDGMWHN